MPFYSRHSSDGRDKFLGDIQDEEDYDQFLNMIYISSNFTDEIQSHYDSSEADVLPPSSSEEEKMEKTRKYQREYHRKYYQQFSMDAKGQCRALSLLWDLVSEIEIPAFIGAP